MIATILLLVFGFLVKMSESSVEIWGMILMAWPLKFVLVFVFYETFKWL